MAGAGEPNAGQRHFLAGAGGDLRRRGVAPNNVGSGGSMSGFTTTPGPAG